MYRNVAKYAFPVFRYSVNLFEELTQEFFLLGIVVSEN
jgi:hypothetical protein